MMKPVSEIINDFDPLCLMPFAPQDEYNNEINEIVDFIQIHSYCDVDTLAKKIYDIFSSRLGTDIFTKNIEECKDVAEEILERTS